MMKMKNKVMMTIIFLLSLSTIFMNWFGDTRTDIVVSGLILLNNPIAVTCIFITLAGIWLRFGENAYKLTYIGLIGIAAMEIYEFFTWHIFTVSGAFDLRLSLDLCYPEFYIAVICMFLTFFIFRYYFQEIDLTNAKEFV